MTSRWPVWLRTLFSSEHSASRAKEGGAVAEAAEVPIRLANADFRIAQPRHDVSELAFDLTASLMFTGYVRIECKLGNIDLGVREARLHLEPNDCRMRQIELAYRHPVAGSRETRNVSVDADSRSASLGAEVTLNATSLIGANIGIGGEGTRSASSERTTTQATKEHPVSAIGVTPEGVAIFHIRSLDTDRPLDGEAFSEGFLGVVRSDRHDRWQIQPRLELMPSAVIIDIESSKIDSLQEKKKLRKLLNNKEKNAKEKIIAILIGKNANIVHTTLAAIEPPPMVENLDPGIVPKVVEVERLLRPEPVKWLEALLQTESSHFLHLVSIAKLNPRIDFRFKDLRGLDLAGLDLTEFDFADSDLRGCDITRASFAEEDTFHSARAVMLAEQWAKLASGGRFEKELHREAFEVVKRTAIHVDLTSYDHIKSSYDVERREVLSVNPSSNPKKYRLSISDMDRTAVILVVPVAIKVAYSVLFEFLRNDSGDGEYWVYGLPQITRAVNIPGLLELILDNQSFENQSADCIRIGKMMIPESTINFGKEVDPEAGSYETLRI